jgi:hypothetical protein
MDFYEAYTRPRSKGKDRASRLGYARERQRQFGDFACLHCGLHVSAEPRLSGVNNRNHCPYCLRSKHVDLHTTGDRLAACKGKMEPVGLTLKRQHKKYAGGQAGELMLIHQCAGCGALSINRIAADDGPASLWEVFEASLAVTPAWQAAAQAAGIDQLGAAAREVVRARLFGKEARDEFSLDKPLSFS